MQNLKRPRHEKKELGESPVVIVEEGSVGLVETNYYSFADPPDKFVLDNGRELGPITVAYETYGNLNKARDNVILVEHALTASSHAAGRNSPEDKHPGWWDVMIGPERLLIQINISLYALISLEAVTVLQALPQ